MNIVDLSIVIFVLSSAATIFAGDTVQWLVACGFRWLTSICQMATRLVKDFLATSESTVQNTSADGVNSAVHSTVHVQYTKTHGRAMSRH